MSHVDYSLVYLACDYEVDLVMSAIKALASKDVEKINKDIEVPLMGQLALRAQSLWVAKIDITQFGALQNPTNTMLRYVKDAIEKYEKYIGSIDIAGSKTVELAAIAETKSAISDMITE